MRDITARKRAEIERDALQTRVILAEKLESLGVMAGGIAHDFNNLLMGVLGNASIAMLDAPPDSPMRRCLEEIESAAQRAANLSQQMLAYSGRATYTFRRLDLRQLVHDAAPTLAASIAKHHRVEFRLDGDAHIHADESQLRQVLLGIVANASEAYEEDGGVITVSVGVEHVDYDELKKCHVTGAIADGTYAILEVSDSGSGMDERLIERIFDPFFTTKFTGRGLGLAAVIGIVRGHRGAISVESAVGKGSTFRIYLPAAVSAGTGPSEPQGLTYPTTAQCVLVIDDEDIVLSVSQQALERAGYTVLTASSGKQAIEIFRKHHEDIGLVILDMTMPRMSGEETFRELKAIHEDIRVIISSGFGRADAALHFDAHDIVDFLQKPYRSHDLVKLVGGVLPRPGAAEVSRTSDFQI